MVSLGNRYWRGMSPCRTRSRSARVVGLLGLALRWAGAVPRPRHRLSGHAIPVSPYFQKKQEDDFWVKERYDRAPILGPLAEGGPDTALDPPSDDEVMRTFERALPQQGGIPFLYECQRNNVRIVKEKIADYIDPPRVFPLIGPAQVHHASYKCTIYYTQVERMGWPLPYTTRDEDCTRSCLHRPRPLAHGRQCRHRGDRQLLTRQRCQHQQRVAARDHAGKHKVPEALRRLPAQTEALPLRTGHRSRGRPPGGGERNMAKRNRRARIDRVLSMPLRLFPSRARVDCWPC